MRSYSHKYLKGFCSTFTQHAVVPSDPLIQPTYQVVLGNYDCIRSFLRHTSRWTIVGLLLKDRSYTL